METYSIMVKMVRGTGEFGTRAIWRRFFDLEVQSGRAERRRALLKRIILKIKDEIKQKRFKVLLSEASPLILAPIGGLR